MKFCCLVLMSYIEIHSCSCIKPVNITLSTIKINKNQELIWNCTLLPRNPKYRRVTSNLWVYAISWLKTICVQKQRPNNDLQWAIVCLFHAISDHLLHPTYEFDLRTFLGYICTQLGQAGQLVTTKALQLCTWKTFWYCFYVCAELLHCMLL